MVIKCIINGILFAVVISTAKLQLSVEYWLVMFSLIGIVINSRWE